MTDQGPARFEDLPDSLVDVAETLGLKVALELMRHFGGLEVKFPVRPKSDHAVIKALGERDGLALCQFLGGQAIYVPRRRSAGAVGADIQRLEKQGLDRGEIAKLLGLSVRHVRRVANRDFKDTRQRDLFD